MKNFIIFILGCFAALLFGELVGEKFGVFGITSTRARESSPSWRPHYWSYNKYKSYYDGWDEGFRAGMKSKRDRAEVEEYFSEEEDEV